MTKEEIITRLREIKPRLMHEYPLHRLALFGSYARGEAGADSDVDILAEVDPSIGLRFVDLAGDLEQALNCKVDLVSRRGIRPRLWAAIAQELMDA